MAGFIDVDAVPWPYVLAFVSLGLIYYLYRRRADAFEEIGFSSKEVALLTLGSTAGWAANPPVGSLGSSVLAVNVGGALVPIILVGLWLVKGKLNVVRALGGIALVSFIAYKVVRFEPSVGIIAVFPYFFLPAVAALAYALLLHPKEPLRSVPVAYASGSIGALLGADVYNLGKIIGHYSASPESSVISIGGAGVFDMVFLAGTLAMAVDILVVVVLARRRPAAATAAFVQYPTVAYGLRDASRTWDAFVRLPDPTPLERAVSSVALSNLALRDGDYARSIRMARLAVSGLLAADAGARALAAARGPLSRDVRRLTAVAERAEDPGSDAAVDLDRLAAGEANHTAKLVLGSLAPLLATKNRLEGL